MSLVKGLGMVAAAAVLATALMAPTGAQARKDRIAEGAVVGEEVGGFSWGPSPPYYPYYHFGSYGVPIGWPGPVWAPYESSCHRETVWAGRHWRRVRVCD
jgi:hypothetical protein